MKRKITLIMIIAVAIYLSLCACVAINMGKTPKKTPEKTPEQMIEDSVRLRCETDVTAECLYSYKDIKSTTVDIVTINHDEEENIYRCQGKVTLIDNYGDTYVGKFTAEYEDSDISGIHEKYIDVETPTIKK